MQEIEILHPHSVQEASDFLLNSDVSYPLAGGSELILLMEKGAVKNGVLVDITKLSLNSITSDDKNIRIGSTTTINELINSSVLNTYIPSLVQAARELGSLQIRTSATIGGNLCAAVPCADTAVPLLTLNALVSIQRNQKSFVVPLTKFFLGPRQTILTKGDIVTEVIIPKPESGGIGGFMKIGRRRALSLAVTSCAVQFSIDNDYHFKTFRVAFGAVAPTPVRGTMLEEYLVGKKVNKNIIQDAAFLISEAISPITDIRATKEYRTQISKVIFQRLTTELLHL